jgi:formate dehydrogenase iron-sulfur subunit
VLDAPGDEKYVVCNADEGDSGTFADRLLMESDPFQLLEAMVIAGVAVGATNGVIYLRSEYPKAHGFLQGAIKQAHSVGLLGDDILGSGKRFDVELRLGAGSYICGEETAMLESIEGKRGMVRKKPPLPALSGLFGKPTLVHNVLTLAAVTTILTEGSEQYAVHGTGRSRGTMPFQLAGNVACAAESGSGRWPVGRVPASGQVASPPRLRSVRGRRGDDRARWRGCIRRHRGPG